MYKGPFYVRLQGYLNCKRKIKKCWLTSPVMQWENSKTLISINGHRYVLKGSIDTELANIYRKFYFIITFFFY